MDENVKDRLNGVIGVTAGYSTYKYVPKYIKKPYVNYMLKSISKVSKEENDTFMRSAQQAFENSDLRSKGVEILHVNDSNYVDVTNKIIQERNKNLKKGMDKIPALNDFFKKQDKKLLSKISTIAGGNNAAYVYVTNQVLLNQNKMGFSTFHELGHAINHNGTGIKHFLNRSRGYFALLAPVLFAIGLLKRKPQNDNPYKTEKQGLGDFIKKNCGWLVGLCLLPKVAEEGLASINGQKMAKDVLSKDMYKKLVKLNTKAWGTYAIGAALTAGFAQLAIYIKDKIVEKK